jgi:CheY-like chemotaxis protein
MTATVETRIENHAARELPPVLFVEDEASDYLAARHQLTKLQVRNPIDRVYSSDAVMDYLGKRGERRYTEGPYPAVIILDLVLPGDNGLDAQAKIRTNLRYRDIPIIAISSAERLNALRSAVQLGANAYMVKPFDISNFCRIALDLKIPLDFTTL